MVWRSVFSFIFDVLQHLAPPEYGNFKTIRDFCQVFDRTEPVGNLMIEGHYRASVSLDNMLDTSSMAGSDSEKSRKTRKKNRWQPYTVPSRRTFSQLSISSGWQSSTSKERPSDSTRRPEKLADKGITDLPDELTVKILSNLDIKDISACRRVNSSWQALVDTNHLRARSFSQRLRFQPISQTVNNYHSFTRGWLTGFSNRGKELAKRLDKFFGNKHFPEILFFNIAELLTKTKRLTCQNVCTFDHPKFVYNNPIFSPDGSHLVTAYMGLTAKIWELVAGQLQHRATIYHYDWGFDASFSPDGSHLVTASDNGKAVEIWGLVAGQWQHKATIRHSDRVRDISFSPDRSHLVTASDDGTTKIWELFNEQWEEKATIKHSGKARSASFSPDGSHIVTASVNNVSGHHTVKIWGLVAGQWVHEATIENFDWMENASFSPDGNHIVTTSISKDLKDHTTKIWELFAGQWQEKAAIKHSGKVRNVSFSPDGSHLLAALDFNTAKICGLVAGRWREKATIPFSGWISKNCFSPDGSHLVTASGDTVKIWGLVGGQWKQKATFQHSDRVRSASFCPDGIHFLTLSGDNVTEIWLLTGC